MKRYLALLLLVASVASAQVPVCPSGFSTSGSCRISSSTGTGAFWSLGGLNGTQAIINPTGCNHCNGAVNYQLAPVNVQAFTVTATFVPNEYNGFLVLQNNQNSDASGFGPCSPGSCPFAAGAGYEGAMYQAFSSNGKSTDHIFGLELYDNHSFASCTSVTCSGASYTGSSTQIYQAQQPPYNPNYGTEAWYWTTDKILTSPVQFSSPATTQQTTTGHTYSATVTYDGTTLTYSVFDVTAGGSCPGATCFTQSWANVNIPSIVGSNTAYVGITGGTNGASANPFYLNSLVYTVNTPPSSQSHSSYTSSASSGSPFVAAPTFTPAAGTYSGTQSVTISSTTGSAYYCYALSASTPAFLPQTDNAGGCTEGTLYTSPVSVSSTQTLYAMAGLNNPALGTSGRLPSNLVVGAYTIGGTPTVATPVITPVTGTYTTPQTVAITDSTPSAVICYTTDGTTPAATSPGTCSHGSTYSGSFSVTSTETIQAIGTLASYINSSVASVTLTINFPTLAAPTFSPVGGTYVGTQTVTVNYPAGSNACVGVNTTPTAPTAGTCGSGGTLYTAPITVSGPETLNAIATQVYHVNSSVASATYAIAVATPTFSPIAGTYTSAQTVSILDATPGATIYYTTDGSTPTTSSTVYTAPLSVGTTQTIKALAVAAGLTNSAVGTALYTINLPPVATPTFLPVAGTYVGPQSVAISTTTPSATIYYTLDGTTPTTSSPVYSSPVSVASSLTVKAIATASGYSQSAVASAPYTITSVPTLAAPTFSPAAPASLVSPQTITISGPAGATLCYTLGATPPPNPTTPGTCAAGSTTYTTGIVITGTTTLNALATQAGYSNSSVTSGVYTLTVATPVFTPPGGSYSTGQIVSISDTTPGSSIYYTIDGTTPTPTSTPYTIPIVVGSTTTLKAIGVLSGASNSAIASATYTLPAQSSITVVFHGSQVTFNGSGSLP